MRNSMRKLLAILGLLILPACVALTPEGEKVRVTNNPDVVRGCEFLSNVTATSGWGGPAGTAGGTANTEATLRNKTAKGGGNTLYLTAAGLHASGEAYRCPPPSPPNK
jgi:hypothetical protein